MNALTLTYDGTTKSLEEWGYSEPRMVLKSRLPSTFTLKIPGGDPVVAPTIPWKGQVTITDVTNEESPVVIFVGYRTDRNGVVSGRARNVTMEFQDAFWFLDRLVYQTQWKVTTDGGATYTSYYYPQVWLFQNIGVGGVAWTYWSAKQQLIDIISYAQTSCSIAIQPGTIDPPIQMPVYPVSSETLWNCMDIVLRTLPDAMTAMDYTTTPPSLNIRIRQNCTQITLPWAGTDGDGRSHVSSEIKSRDDLQVPEVVIKYRTNDGGFTAFSSDVYPPGAEGLVDGSTPQSFNLLGGQVKTLSGTVTAAAVDPADVDFWTLVKPDLDADDIDDLALVDSTINGGSGHPQGITILDSTGATVTLSTTPNRITAGQVASWMKNDSDVSIIAKEVTITAFLKYVKLDPDGYVNQTNVTAHQVSWRGKLTNSGTGLKTYSTTASSIGGESPPPNFAYLAWCSANNVAVNYVDGVVTPPDEAPDIESPENLQWEGWHEIVEKNISTYFNCNDVLNLSGGAAAWEEMNATIYSVEYDFFRGITRLNFGPHKTLNIREFFSLLEMARTRIEWDDPNATASGSASGEDELGSDTAKENTVEHSTPTRITDSLIGSPDDTGRRWHCEMDAGSGVDDFPTTAGVRLIRRETDGTQTTHSNLLSMFISDIDGSSDVDVIVKFRKLSYCVLDTDGVTRLTKYRWVLCGDEQSS